MNYQAQSIRLCSDLGEKTAPNFLEVIDELSIGLSVDVVSNEIEIILSLFHKSPLPLSELRDNCSASTAKFFSVLAKLCERNIIMKIPDPSDNRRRLYDLQAEVGSYIQQELYRCAKLAMNLTDEVELCSAFEETLEIISAQYEIDSSRSRFTIVSSLFKAGHWCPNEGLALAKTSRVSFFAAMDHLKSTGVVECYEDPADRRKRRCQLTPLARQTFLDSIRTIKRLLAGYAAGRQATRNHAG